MTFISLPVSARIVSVAASVSCLALSAAQAQEGAHNRDTVHNDKSTDIVITAPYVAELDLLAGQSVVSEDELTRSVRPQIGDTLTAQAGVSATSFSPGSSRPVLRGFQGARIAVLSDGLGNIDVSNTSADHGVTIDPLTAERIEVLRGPAVLLFGSQAVGGAVNVIDRRIPRVAPDNGVHFDAIGTYGSAADERGGGAAVDVAIVPNLVVHLDGSYRKSDDLRVGGFVLSPGLRAAQLDLAAEADEEGEAEEAAEARALASLRGAVPNSGTETWTLGGGMSLLSNDGSSLGFAVSRYDSRYGVPSRPGAEHHHEEGEGEGAAEEEGEAPVSIDMVQTRVDLRGEVKTGGGFIDSVRVRAGYADYQHTEFEGNEVGTLFLSKGLEGRLELIQSDRNGWRGVVGVQGYVRDFNAIGAEAFVPKNSTTQLGVFTLQEIEIGQAGIELAARYERSRVASPSVLIGAEDDAVETAVARTFDAASFAAGAHWWALPNMKLGINLSRTARAPAAEELFSNGPHVATQAFEVGDPDLRLERSWGLEAYARGRIGPVKVAISAYHGWFSNFIYEVETGLERDDLPLFVYAQDDVRHYGFEADISADLFDLGGVTIAADAVADYTRAKLVDGGGNIPRIPPLRLLGGLSARSGPIDGRIEVEWTDAQRKLASVETPTDGFTLVNAAVTWHPLGKDNETTLILSANNIFDVDARRHASFTKDFVPLAGRDIRVSARLSF